MGKKIWNGILAGLGIFVLIMDAKTAILGARNALELCLASVIPSLFPFIILSGMLVSVLNGVNARFLRPVSSILRIPQGKVGVFLAGILGGYPIGAQCVYQTYKSGGISKKNAERMLMFCSNAGPSFLFGILGMKFPAVSASWALWVIHISSAILVARMIPSQPDLVFSKTESKTITLPQALKNAVITMGYICGWIILFRIILTFLDRWFLWLLPTQLQVGIYGILELANGCLTLDAISLPGLRFVIASGMLAFGGLCVAMQTVSVVGNLGIMCYLKGKILQTIISIPLSIMIQWIIFSPTERMPFSLAILLFSVLIPVISWILFRKSEIKGSIPAIIGV